MKNTLSTFVALTFVSLAVSRGSFAVEDELFSGRPSGEGTQIILGITDLVLADFVSGVRKGSSSDPRVIALEDANGQLRRAQNLLTSDDKAARIQELNQLMKADKVSEETVESIAEDIQRLAKTSTVTNEAKQAAMTAAEKGLADARAVMLNSTRKIKGGAFAKSIRAVRVMGGAIFIGDLLGRIYVWNALEKNPGFFPAGKVISHYGSKVYEELKAEGFFSGLYGSRKDDSVERNPELKTH